MKAVSFDVSVPRYLLAKALGGLTTSVTFGRLSGLQLRDLDPPPLPGSAWVRLQVRLAGICGTDIGNLTFSSSPAMEPFASFPAVLGHEILGTVVEVGDGVSRVKVGERVVVDPMISCQVRGWDEDPCPSCRAGLPSTCERSGEEGRVRVGARTLSRGLTIGYHRDLPGGWGEGLIAHESQVFRVPDTLGDREAVLIEPLAIGVHAVLRSSPDPSGPVLIIGSGPIAMAALWALRATGFRGEVVAQAKRESEMALAGDLGADRVVRPGLEARGALVDSGAQAYQPLVGPEVYAGGGFRTIFDCVGSTASLQQALHYASPRGKIVVLGCSAKVPGLDLTFLWARELDVQGYVGYGEEEWEGQRLHTFEITRDLLESHPLPVDRIVTHVFPLGQYVDALVAAANRRRSGAMKVLLQPETEAP